MTSRVDTYEVLLPTGSGYRTVGITSDPARTYGKDSKCVFRNTRTGETFRRDHFNH